MKEMSQASIMTLCPEQPFDVPKALQKCFWQLGSGKQVLEIMRLVPIDLLLVSLTVSDIDVWQLIKTVQIKDSKIKWILLCGQLDAKTEVQARTLGVFRIMHTRPDVDELYELAVAIRQRNKQTQILA